MATRQLFALNKSITKVLAAKTVLNVPQSRALFSFARVKAKSFGQELPAAKKISISLFLGTTLTGVLYRKKSTDINKMIDADAQIVQNMKSGKFSVQEVYYRTFQHAWNSVAGSDILRTVPKPNTSQSNTLLRLIYDVIAYPLEKFLPNSILTKKVTSYFNKIQWTTHELIDAKTGSIQDIDLPGNTSILTPSYFVTIVGEEGLEIRCRKTGEAKMVKFPDDVKVHHRSQRLGQNNNPDYPVILYHSKNQKFLVNLETAEFTEINIPACYSNDSIQIYNDQIAYLEDVQSGLALKVLKTNGTVLSKVENLPYYGIMYHMEQPDQVVISSYEDSLVSWKVVNLNGDVISNGKFSLPKFSKIDFPQIASCKDWIIFNQGRLNIVDRASGSLLTTFDTQPPIINLQSKKLYYPRVHVQKIDNEKFLITSENSAQILDFGVVHEVPEVNTVVVEKDGETLTQVRGKMHEMMQAFKSERYDQGLQSVIMSQTETETVGLVYFAQSDFAVGNYERKLSYVWKVPHPGLSYVCPKQFEKQDKAGLFFREVFVDGKWIYADLSPEQAKETLVR